MKVVKNCWFREEGRKWCAEPRLNKIARTRLGRKRSRSKMPPLCCCCMRNNWGKRSFEEGETNGNDDAHPIQSRQENEKNRNLTFAKWALIMVIILGAFNHLSLVYRRSARNARLRMRRTCFRTRNTSYHFIVPRWWIKGPRERKYRCHSTADNHFILTCDMPNDDKPEIRATANNKHCISLNPARKLFSLDVSSSFSLSPKPPPPFVLASGWLSQS